MQIFQVMNQKMLTISNYHVHHLIKVKLQKNHIIILLQHLMLQ